MDAKYKLLEQLSGKLQKRATELDYDAARLNGIGKTTLAEELRDIATKIKIIATKC